jgi:HAMP domain-containing protein
MSTSSTQVAIIGAGPSGLLLGAFVSYWVTSTIVKPVVQLQSAIEDIESKGDFSQRVRINSGDEIGLMAKSFNGMLEAQQKAISEVSSVVGQMAEGDFSGRVHADLNGDLLRMKNAVNESADGIQTTMRGLNKVMLALYNGQFDVQSNAQGKGEFKLKVLGSGEEFELSRGISDSYQLESQPVSLNIRDNDFRNITTLFIGCTAIASLYLLYKMIQKKRN